MVDHDHQRIKAVGWGQIGDEVNRELFEQKSSGGGDRDEGRGGRVGDNLVLLAYRTTRDEFGNKNRKTWPPKVSFDYGFSTEATEVTREG